jgi:hypothetical protein
VSTSTRYGASTVRRDRWTRDELTALDDAIIDELREEHPATVRAAFYRVEAAGAVPKTEAGYRRVARRILKLRRDGDLPYRWITDGTRYFLGVDTWGGINEALQDWHAAYRRDIWRNQDVVVEFFTEKDAISGLLTPVTERWGVRLGVLRGYCSESFAFEAAMDYAAQATPIHVYHFGDHDPSGVNAWEDFQKKVRGFAPVADITFVRAAVTLRQIHELNLPTRPTKRSDTRAANFEGESVEVDAIRPSHLRGLAEGLITQHVDPDRLRVTHVIEQGERDQIQAIIDVAGGVA